MSLDLLIRGGTVVDGTGAPAYSGDVAIADGRIVDIGRVREGAKRTIDAGGLVVSPGFIDPHTHYDAQICWDREVTPSSWHGITTVMMGNCGVGIAPCRPKTREIATWDLVNVEAMPFDALTKGITWDWETFPEYMDAAQRRGSAINLAFFAPLTPMRHYVMGEASMERAATTQETADIAKLLAQAVEAGAYGFTSTLLPQHVGYQGRPLASQLASRDELAAYCHVLRDAGRGSIEVALTRAPGMITDDECETLDFLLTESRSKVTWLALLQRDDAPEACQQSLKRAASLIARGGIPQITCRPLTVQLDLRTPFVFADRAVWKPAYNRTPQEQMALYGSADFRDAVREDFRKPGLFCNRWDRVSVKEVGNPALKRFEGRRLDELAVEMGKDGLAALLDIAIQDELETQFSIALFNADESRIPELLRDNRTMLGLSDGGAHVDMLCDAGYATHLLGHWVRQHKVMSLEQAVARLTSEPADFLGIRRRGRLARGMAADVAVFDPATVGSGSPTMRHDLPGGGRRLVVESHGVEYTVVNGTVAFERGRCVESGAGQVLRSGTS